MFEIGKVYKRKEELHLVYGGQRQGGISTPGGKPYIFVFTGDSGEAYGYEDKFMPDGTFWYTGEGQVGDMRMDKGNLAIKNHSSNGKTIHVFEYVKKAYVSYMGEAVYLDHHVEERPDKNGNMRDAFIFHLALDVLTSDAVVPAPSDANDEIRNLNSKSLSELRSAAMRNTNQGASTQEIQTTTRIRSEAIKLYAKARANGKCEGCREDAPFESRKGPYLEVHHVYRLGDGGPDHPDSVVAICPNCHRRVHYGIDGHDYNKSLLERLKTIESVR